RRGTPWLRSSSNASGELGLVATGRHPKVHDSAEDREERRAGPKDKCLVLATDFLPTRPFMFGRPLLPAFRQPFEWRGVEPEALEAPSTFVASAKLEGVRRDGCRVSRRAYF